MKDAQIWILVDRILKFLAHTWAFYVNIVIVQQNYFQICVQLNF